MATPVPISVPRAHPYRRASPSPSSSAAFSSPLRECLPRITLPPPREVFWRPPSRGGPPSSSGESEHTSGRLHMYAREASASHHTLPTYYGYDSSPRLARGRGRGRHRSEVYEYRGTHHALYDASSPPLRAIHPPAAPSVYPPLYRGRGVHPSPSAGFRAVDKTAQDKMSINLGFQSLRGSIPSSLPTDSKAVVLRKAVAHIGFLEDLLRQHNVEFTKSPHEEGKSLLGE
ncbi:uncharacterized protein L203_104890 [Cryptococcus depauperatus CBS 7841]|uniref:BHLH domain-containing protein n=1 Tax=Cryptococcus depauperatus CBS 7841 TaxID=1295531 RepID=A0AAJ8JWE3_9TREE